MQKNVYQGKYLTLTEEKIHGHIYERVHLREGVHIIPFQNDKVLFMREFRPHEKGDRWKLVSGWCDKDGVTPLEHAQQELAEEVSMYARDWELFYDTCNSYATINENTYYFVCKDIHPLEEKVTNPDIGAVIHEYQWFSFAEIFEFIHQGKIWPDTSAMAALVYLSKQKKK